jgi:DNA-binding response OmpR family regulator
VATGGDGPAGGAGAGLIDLKALRSQGLVANPLAISERMPSSSQTTPPSGAVLIVDDDAAIRSLLAALLRRQGLITEAVEDGELAIAKLKEKSYSLVLLDLMMPNVDGFAVLDFMKAAGNRTPVIVVTAAGPTATRSLNEFRLAAMIRKPFDVNELTDMVAAIVNAESIRDQNAS